MKSEDRDWEIPDELQPRAHDVSFDLGRALRSVVSLRTEIPADAFTASILGTERAGSGVVIRDDGLVLTIGYLISEAETIWLGTADGRAIPGHVVAYDQESGFGLVQALGRLELPALGLGRSADIEPGEQAIAAAAGGRSHAVRTQVITQQEFAGYWEYFLERAIFTAPAHPFWGGAALIGPDGRLLGIGSLHLQQSGGQEKVQDVNMFVPIDLLPPILDDLLSYGRRNRPARPWLGLYGAEAGERVTVAGVADGGPAERAGIQVGDIVHAIGDETVASLADLWQQVWALGPAGVEVPLLISRGGRMMAVRVTSADRASFLKAPRLH